MPSSSPAGQPAATRPPSGRLRSIVMRVVGHMLVEDGDLLSRWRARLVAALLFAICTAGMLLVASTVSILLRQGEFPMVVLDIALIGMMYWLLLSRRATYLQRAFTLTLGSWLIGMVALITLGPFSTTLGWLFTSVFLSAFLLGQRATVVIVVGTLVLLASVAFGITIDAFDWARGDPTALSRWIAIALDFTFLIGVLASANVLTFQLLEREDRARVRAERQLAEGRRHQALGTLASGIAHDFNNLLVPMMSNVELARDAVPVGSDAWRALRDAGRSAERARDLVQRILAFGRGVDSQRDAMDIAGVVRETVDLLRPSVPADVRLRVELCAAPTVMASRAELHQILQNLLGNALHAVRESGDIAVTVDMVDDALHRWVRLQVRDTGTGMEDAVRERIFDPYFTTREGSRGTGLGLPIVRSIIESMGGSIVAHSVPGRGSTFTVLLPAVTDVPTVVAGATDAVSAGGADAANASAIAATIAKAGGAAAVGLSDAGGRATVRLAAAAACPPGSNSAASLTPLPTHGRHVLLVEDEASVRRATERQLRALGYRVTSAESAPAALALCRGEQWPFDLLLTDHRMPGGSGRQLALDVRHRFPDARVVLMSGDVHDALGSDVDGERLIPLQKPFSRDELAAALNEAAQPSLAQ